MEHAANLADVSASVLAIVSVVHGELLGEPSGELRAKLATAKFLNFSRPTSRCSHRLGRGLVPSRRRVLIRVGWLGPTVAPTPVPTQRHKRDPTIHHGST